MLDYGKHKKSSGKKNCKNREYHVQKNEYVEHQYIKFYCTTNQFPLLPFCGPHNKAHVVRGLSKHYHMCFDTKLGYDTCAIHFNPCECTHFASAIDSYCNPDVSQRQQPCYQPVKDY